jgi:hypothetical protein
VSLRDEIKRLADLRAQVLTDLGRVPDPLPEPQVPDPVTPEDAKARSRFELWLEEHGLSQHELPPPQLALYQELERIEQNIWKREGTAKNAPTWRDARKIERHIKALHERAEEIRAELGWYTPCSFADLDEMQSNPLRCSWRDCLNGISDDRTAWEQSQLCDEHYAANFGRHSTDQKGRL